MAWEQSQRALEAQVRASALDAELGARLARAESADDVAAVDDLQQALALLMRRRAQVERGFSEADALIAKVPEAAPLRVRLETERARYRERQERVSGKLRDAIAGLAPDQTFAEALFGGLKRVAGRGERDTLRELRTELEGWQPRRPILGASTLNYVRGEMTPLALPTSQMTPAYEQAAAAGPALEDTTTGREVELSPEVIAQANALEGPIGVVEFVRNECQLDWYLGVLKGSTETLRERRGNDADLSSLLVALLRAKNVPARFVRGTIELPIEKVAELLGLMSATELDSPSPFVLDASRRNRVQQALSAAGIPFQAIQSGGQVAKVRFAHVWVEAYLPYADYRGAGTSAEGKQWVPIDAAIPGGAKYAANVSAIDAFAPFTARALTDAALLDASQRSPLQSYRDTVQNWLNASHPGATYDSVLRRVVQRAETLDLVPGSLPYVVVSVQGESAFLPESQKHRVRLTLRDDSGTILDLTLPLHQLVGHRSSLLFDGATDADVALVSQSGQGLYGVPATLVELNGLLRVDGVEVAHTSRPIPLGVTLAWSAELLLPNGTSRRIDNELISGNSVALGFAAPFNRFVEPAVQAPGDVDGPAQRFLFGRVAAYANEWTAAEEELAALTGVALIRPTANVAFVQNQLHVVTTLGVRQRVEFRGVEIDADLRTAVPLELVAGRATEFLELSGHHGSYLEAKALADGTGEKSISATEVIREANRRALTVLRINASNAATELPRLTADAEVQRDVTDQVALGREVIIPAAPMTIENWDGSGYIAIDPTTREAAYLLSGIVSGGTTVVSPRFWLDQHLVEQLTQSTARNAVTDLSLVARIVALPPTTPNDRIGVVGQPLGSPLGVLVTTLEGLPIKGAPVRFRRTTNSFDQPLVGPAFGGSPPAPEFTTVTDDRGIALARLTLDTKVFREAGATGVLLPGSPYPQLAGLNNLTAETCPAVAVQAPALPTCVAGASNIVLAQPFTAVANPDRVNKVDLRAGIDFGVPSLDVGSALTATVVDQYDNWLANVPVLHTASPNSGRFYDGAVANAGTVILDVFDAQQTVTRTEISSTLGETDVGWIAGPTAGLYVVNATASGQSGQRTFFIADTQEYVFRVAGPDRSYAGVVNTSIQAPQTAVVLHATPSPLGPQWAPVSDRDPNIADFKVVAQLRGPTQAEVGRITSKPSDTSPLPPIAAALRTGRNTVFWPKHVVQNGYQDVRFSAEVYEWQISGGARVKVRVCCSDPWFLSTPSSLVHVTALRQALGELPVVTPDGRASTDDAAIAFEIAPGSASTTYVRFTQRPNVNGDLLVAVPDPTVWPRHPSDPTLVAIPGGLGSQLVLPIVDSFGGEVKVEAFAIEPTDDSVIDAGLTPDSVNTIRIEQPNVVMTARVERAPQLVLASRTYATAGKPDAGLPGSNLLPDGGLRGLDHAMLTPGALLVSLTGSGRLTLREGATLLAELDVFASKVTGVSEIVPVSGLVPEIDAATHQLRFTLAPDLGQRTIALNLTDPAGLVPPQNTSVLLETTIDDMSALPVGQVFVKDVSVTDGHLVKQAEDLRLSSRGPPIAFARTYTNRGFTEGTLGQGWSHTFDTEVVEQFAEARATVIGGEGTGQPFECSAGLTNCRAPYGNHSTLKRDPANSNYLLYRARGGTVWRYGPGYQDTFRQTHYPIASIIDPQGNEVVVERKAGPAPQDIFRIWEAGNGRFLQFAFTRPQGARHDRVSELRLFANPAPPARLAATDSGTFLNVCVQYQYDARAQLSSVRRFDGDCTGGSAVLREEGFTYSTSLRPSQQNNLVEYRDPDGTITRFEYYSASDPLPGEGAFVLFGDKEERVKAVVEPATPTTSYRTPFTYSLVPTPRAGITGTSVVQLYSTNVGSPRPGVPDTVYFQEAAGTTANVSRPLDANNTATTRVDWDPVHIKPIRDEDARGRVTRRVLDEFGNTTELHVETTALGANGSAAATAGVVDATGTPVAETVQKWSYDVAFAKVTCELDAEGRVTTYTLDSNGADPRFGTVIGTGLTLETRRHANVASRALIAATPRCADIASAVGQSPADIVTRTRYCAVNGAPCPAGGRTGDVYERIDAEGHLTRTVSVDGFGMPLQVARVSSTGTTIITTSNHYDERSRLDASSDNRGRFTEVAWDGLDRQTCETKHNTRGNSPGMLTLRQYFPGGQLRTEVTASGTCDSPVPAHTRTVTLDSRGRVASSTDTGVNLSAPIVSTFAYDEANNRVSTTDGRGVTTTSTFDFADRVVQTGVAVTDTTLFAAANGEGATSFTTSTSSYDAVGNKVSETDLHGYQTTFSLDSLYRVIGTKSAAVPGPQLVISPTQYSNARGLDLVGNVVRETDGNGQPTTRTFDFANRLLSVTDAVGRVEESTWDGNGNRLTQKQRTGSTTHLTRTFTYDALQRPLTTTEVAAAAPTSTKELRYDDSASGHAVVSRDARGFLTVTKLDDLDRPFEVTVDAPSTLLARTPDDARAGAPLALTSTTAYDVLGNAAVVTDARGNSVTSTFDAVGRVVAKTWPLGVTEAWTYDAAGHVTSMVDKRGVTHGSTFDALGREKRVTLVESVSNAGATLTQLTRTYVDAPDGTGLWRVEETDAAGSTTARFTDALGRVVRSRDALGYFSDVRFDAKTQRRARDAKGYVSEVDTDAVYRVTATREFDLGAASATYSRTTTYDDVARLETALDWRGTPTVLERDGLGRLLRRTRGSGADTQTDTSVFNLGGLETLHTDANGHKVEWVYDGAGRKVLETKGLGSSVAATWTTSFDEVGNVVSMKGPRTTGVAFDVRTTFDALNRAVRIEDANGFVTYKAYDGAGLLLCQKSPLGDTGSFAHGASPSASTEAAAACQSNHVTKWAYDEAGQLLKVTTPLGFETTYVWDASRKRLLAKQDANQNLTTYAYDARHLRTDEFQHLDAHGRLTPAQRDTVPQFETPNLPGQQGTLRWRTSYDANGNVQTRIDPLGQTSTESHGLRNRLDAVTYSLHVTPRVLPSLDSEVFAYDENGNVTSVAQLKRTSAGAVTESTLRTFDVLDRLKTVTRYDSKLTTYGYDAKGNRTSVTDFQNVATTYTFDALDRLETTVTPDGTTSSSYFPDSLPKTVAFFNGLHESRCYDAAGRLLKLSTGRTSAAANPCAPANLVTQYAYSFDADGNRLTQDEVLTPPGASSPAAPQRTEYGYDDESRLVGVRYPEGTVALYQLDSVGNRVGERKAPSSAVSALTAAAFLLVPSAALSNDVLATFNRVDSLQSVVDSRAPSKNASFLWDEAGNLVRQTTASRDRRFDWDIKQTLTRVADDGLESGRYDYGSDGLRTKRLTSLESVEYVLDGDEVLLEADGASPAHPARRRYTYGASALAVTDINGSTRTTRALHVDALGSPGTETTLSASIAVNRQYDAWGAYRNGTAPTEVDAKLGFTGHQYDVETGLTYARARYYDAEYGRFLTRDSVEGSLNDAPSLHRYAYVRANPLRYTDRSGHNSMEGAQKFGPLPAVAPIVLSTPEPNHGEVAAYRPDPLSDLMAGFPQSRLLTDSVQVPLVAAVAGPAVGPYVLATAEGLTLGTAIKQRDPVNIGLAALPTAFRLGGAIRQYQAPRACVVREGLALPASSYGPEIETSPGVFVSNPVRASARVNAAGAVINAEFAVAEENPIAKGLRSGERPELANGQPADSASQYAVLSSRGVGNEPFDPAKLARIQASLAGQVEFKFDPEWLERYGDEAQFQPNVVPNVPSTIVLRPNPSRAAVIEELMHFGQWKDAQRQGMKAADFGAKENVIKLELEAQKRMLRLDETRTGGFWSEEEHRDLQTNLQFWENASKTVKSQ